MALENIERLVERRQLSHHRPTRREVENHHRNFEHPKRGKRITISGSPGSDAQPYQVREVASALNDIRS
jgi:hypothetical protein